ncbi:hypothetical protein HY839_00135 [Candidatus Azambacteria bacterium]|nr:hypothetical protein [Candidatus Azambacteria bacterium]
MQFLYNTVKERIKSIGERVTGFAVERKEMFAHFAELALVAAIFFGLGVLYTEHMPARTMPLSIELSAQEKGIAAVAAITNKPAIHKAFSSEKGEYVASKNGSKYYLTTCKNTIKEANKVYFNTREDAEKAGFTPSQTCFK